MSLSRSQSLRVAAVLEDCSNQVAIVGHTVRVQIRRKRGAAAAPQETARLAKLKMDCNYILQQVNKLHLELEEKQSFNLVLDVIEEQTKKQMDDDLTREKEKELKQKKEAVDSQNMELQQKTEQLQDLEEQIRHLKNCVQDQSIKNAEWKKTTETNMMLHLQLSQKETSKAEKLLEEQLELRQKKLKEEVRIHVESMKFLQNQHEDLQQQLQKWKQLTVQMLEEKEKQLNSVSCKRTLNLDKLSEMRRKFREMEKVVMEDREEQEKLRQLQEQDRAATKLQAWWRGCKVRRGLCTFTKTNESKKVKKKKEGKKKKKK